MLGAIVGDIVGSIYEFNNCRSKFFELFKDASMYTDDTVMTLAVAQALMDGGTKERYVASMKRLGRLFPDSGYGSRFNAWLHAEGSEPYNSFGNGSAMRVSPVAWAYDTLEEVERAAALSAEVTHNHPEGIKGAQATAAAVFMARVGKSKREVETYVTNVYGYDLTPTCEQIRAHYAFDETCQGTVPQAIIAWLESDCFEDAIRNAVSLGGDSDTLAAITGAIAQADYGIPPAIATNALNRLPPELRAICVQFSKEVLFDKL